MKFAALVLFSVTAFSTVVPACAADAQPTQPVPPTAADTAKFPALVKDLIIRDDQIGQGKVAQKGRAALVQYTGWVYDPSKPDGKGNKFDSSRDNGLPFGFLIGVAKAIAGWDIGIIGMKVGGRRTLIIPPSLAYGEKAAAGKFPANATLLFELDLINIIGGPASESNPPPTSPP